MWGMMANAIPQLFTPLKWQPLHGVHHVCVFELDIYIYFFFIFEIFIFHVSEILRATEISKDTLVTNVSKINRLQKLSDIMLCCG